MFYSFDYLNIGVLELMLLFGLCRGHRHQVAAIPAQQNVASTSVAAYKDRMVRYVLAVCDCDMCNYALLKQPQFFIMNCEFKLTFHLPKLSQGDGFRTILDVI